MGYKHRREIHLGSISAAGVDQLRTDAATLFREVTHSGIALEFGYDVGYPVLRSTGGVIIFNGVDNDSCETFVLDARWNYVPSVPRTTRDAEHMTAEDRGREIVWEGYEAVQERGNTRWGYVKTLELPYDAVVCAVLLRPRRCSAAESRYGPAARSIQTAGCVVARSTSVVLASRRNAPSRKTRTESTRSAYQHECRYAVTSVVIARGW
jgi:hypothetical protein